RLYEMFIGDFEKSVPWSQNGIKGCRRFLDRIWKLKDAVQAGDEFSKDLEIAIHKTIKKVSEDMEALKFNTAIAALMSLLNEYQSKGSITSGEFKIFLMILNPIAPHITEELWSDMNYGEMITEQTWPQWDEEKTKDEEIEIVIQINGKIKDKIIIPTGSSQEFVREKFLKDQKITELLSGKQIVKEIYVPERIYNIVVR
ncbi:MAG: class I tRNA ligase family protein, partial [Alkaliphilus sp.]|nr:class I tRNA ligase family protein [Alkaliphilus sp.]